VAPVNIRAYLDLIKPRVTLSALATTLLGFVMGADRIDSAILFHTLLGAFLIGAGSNCLNQYLERDVDAKMRRTENRPLPSGRLEPRQAFIFGSSLIALGVIELFFGVNFLTAFVGFATFVSYVLIYTPLKRLTVLNSWVGAVPGALPSMIGWAAARGSIHTEAWILFAFFFVWQLPHFFAIAWVYREDYARSGLKMITLYDPDGRLTAWQIVFHCVLLLPISLLPVAWRMSGSVYFFAAVISGVAFSGFAVYLMIYRLARAKKFVGASVIYLLVIIAFMIADKV
jgi:heme o synthase